MRASCISILNLGHPIWSRRRNMHFRQRDPDITEIHECPANACLGHELFCLDHAVFMGTIPRPYHRTRCHTTKSDTTTIFDIKTLTSLKSPKTHELHTISCRFVSRACILLSRACLLSLGARRACLLSLGRRYPGYSTKTAAIRPNPRRQACWTSGP